MATADSPNSAEVVSVLKPAVVNVAWVGFSKWASQSMNLNDVGAAFKAFLLTVGRQHGYHMEVESRLFDEVALFEEALERDDINLVVIDGFSYLAMKSPELIRPSFVGSLNGRIGFEYLLLTRRGRGFDNLASLRGKDLLLGYIPSSPEGQAWLGATLQDAGLGDIQRHFGKLEFAGKASAVVLPVFFGSRAACVVDQAGFEVMKEMNPQVGQALQVIAASETVVDHLICLRSSPRNPSQFDADFVRMLTELHQTPVGQQILTLFKLDQLVPFSAKHLDETRKLRVQAEHSMKGAQR